MIVLADTSVWIDHFRAGNQQLQRLLGDGAVLGHPLICGELACGNLKGRAAVLSNLAQLPQATVATNDEVLHLIEKRRLWGRGLGIIDTHLVASALLGNCRLWTLDKRLAAAASEMGIG